MNNANTTSSRLTLNLANGNTVVYDAAHDDRIAYVACSMVFAKTSEGCLELIAEAKAWGVKGLRFGVACN